MNGVTRRNPPGLWSRPGDERAWQETTARKRRFALRLHHTGSVARSGGIKSLRELRESSGGGAKSRQDREASMMGKISHYN